MKCCWILSHISLRLRSQKPATIWASITLPSAGAIYMKHSFRKLVGLFVPDGILHPDYRRTNAKRVVPFRHREAA